MYCVIVFLTTDNWIDVKRIEQLRDDDFEKKFGNRPDHSRPTFFGELKKQAIKLFTENEYQLLIDSDELSPFDSSGMVDFLTFEKENNQIKITQVDWRDDYFIYRIEVNGKNWCDLGKGSKIDALARRPGDEQGQSIPRH